MPRNEVLDNNNHGTQGALVFANADGTSPKVYGAPGEFPWASWSPDGKQFTSLSITGVCLVDIASRQTVTRFPRKGLFQQTIGHQTVRCGKLLRNRLEHCEDEPRKR
jgi:hypothetical protein